MIYRNLKYDTIVNWRAPISTPQGEYHLRLIFWFCLFDLGFRLVPISHLVTSEKVKKKIAIDSGVVGGSVNRQLSWIELNPGHCWCPKVRQTTGN